MTDLPLAAPSSTPFLVVDLPVLRRNVDAAAAWAARIGARLRPHVKTHKSPALARLQQESGAAGITVATLGEAEVFAAAGFDDIFVAYPVWLDDTRAARLRALSRRARVLVGLDSHESARRIAHCCPGTSVVVEVDSGHHRSGLAAERAAAVALDADSLGLDVEGLFTFPGHSYSPAGRARAALDERQALAAAAAAMRSAGVPPRVLSGGSSPSMGSTAAGVLDEVRPGAYVFNDAQQWELGACGPEDIALTCHATVVSHAGGRLVLDAGTKVLGADRPAWACGHGRLLDDPDARIVIASEHHAVVETDRPLPALGSLVRVVPNHCCNAVNLVDELWVTQAGVVVDRWPVAARGANA